MGTTTAVLLVAFCALLAAGGEALEDVKLQWPKDRWYNPSVVFWQDKFVSAGKLTTFKRYKNKTWWINGLFMCEGPRRDPVSKGAKCQPFNPWGNEDYPECEFDSRVRGGKLDNSGLGDVKVWTWPGRGIYAIFGRKPMAKPGDGFCSDFVVYHQWLAQVRPAPGQKPDDPWRLAKPLPLLPHREHSYPEHLKYVMEKNWMPFVYKEGGTGPERLFVTYMVSPHVIFELHPSGVAEHIATTHDESLMAKFQGHDVHGGPPVAYVPESMSGTKEAYYLGIMHHIERFDQGRVRLYRHFAYRFETEPPFAITGISDELPLVFNQTYKTRTAWVAFVSGLHVSNDGHVLISYGAADIESRLLRMRVPELEAMFTGNIQFRNITVPYDRVVHRAHARQRRRQQQR